MFFIIGGKGLVGSAIVKYVDKNNFEYEIIQKENKQSFFGKSCDTLIFANGNPLKYKANQDPIFDFHASVDSVVEYVHNIEFKSFVLLSSIDVYDRNSNETTTSEDIKINTNALNTYGYNKLLAENYVKHYCKNYLIFRLGGLVGVSLKKNPAYDFINHEKKVMISPDSQLNFINTRLVAESIFKIIEINKTNEIFNLASKNSLKIKDIKKIIGYDSEYTKDSKDFLQNYHINTKKIQKFVNLSTSEEAIEEYFKSLTNSEV